MWRVWPSILPVAASDDPVTALKSLALNAVMLAVTLGVLYWVLQGEPEPTPVPPLEEAPSSTGVVIPDTDTDD